MNIAYCEDEKIQLEYMEQLIRKWADERKSTAIYFGYGSAKELLFEHPDSFPFDLLFWILIWTAWMAWRLRRRYGNGIKISLSYF